MDDLKQLTKLKEKVENLRQQRDRAGGTLEELMRRLKEEFGVSSVKEGRSLLEKMKKDLETRETQYQKDFEDFKKSWEDVL